VIPVSNGGLGDTYVQINQIWGEPNQETIPYDDGTGFLNYQNNAYIVMYSEGRAMNIIHNLPQRVSFSEARKIALTLSPSDAII
jgi:hypothetical protein